MNPQNMGPHIQMRHSSLWRKSMWTPQDVLKRPVLHKQMNEMAMTGKSWRERNCFIQTNYQRFGRSSLPKNNRSRMLSETLYHDKKETQKTRTFIKSIEKEAQRLDRNRQLVQGMNELRRMNLLTNKELSNVKFPGIIRHEHVHNDYHQRQANPGYSRNEKGKFFTR